MITVRGRRNSVNVQKVLWALEELDVPHARENVGGSFGDIVMGALPWRDRGVLFATQEKDARVKPAQGEWCGGYECGPPFWGGSSSFLQKFSPCPGLTGASFSRPLGACRVVSATS
ncbi:hypothetical protein [Aestuariivirga sp.]|uniref:hypothetical protein n=1 Tax=Aestuariivirga sp. TaxID=2650926 RepID=UPI0025BC8F52|nr:hypothetical protein [Aestuariivirga sp.]MCA3555196.1 hypothetical protein [Aestuariivirga sp.]